MNTYETSGTVQEQGQVLVADVPFAPGTEVRITISPKLRSKEEMMPLDDEAVAAARDRMWELFRTVKGFRNSPRIPR